MLDTISKDKIHDSFSMKIEGMIELKKHCANGDNDHKMYDYTQKVLEALKKELIGNHF
jgi:hypothetical protein